MLIEIGKAPEIGQKALLNQSLVNCNFQTLTKSNPEITPPDSLDDGELLCEPLIDNRPRGVCQVEPGCSGVGLARDNPALL